MADRATYHSRGGRILGIGVLAVFVAVSIGGVVLGAAGLFVVVCAAGAVYGAWWVLVASAYDGGLSADGVLWFKGIARRWDLDVQDVTAISEHRGEGTRWYTIRTAKGRIRIDYRSGEEIVAAILAACPSARTKDRGNW